MKKPMKPVKMWGLKDHAGRIRECFDNEDTAEYYRARTAGEHIVLGEFVPSDKPVLVSPLKKGRGK